MTRPMIGRVSLLVGAAGLVVASLLVPLRLCAQSTTVTYNLPQSFNISLPSTNPCCTYSWGITPLQIDPSITGPTTVSNIAVSGSATVTGAPTGGFDWIVLVGSAPFGFPASGQVSVNSAANPFSLSPTAPVQFHFAEQPGGSAVINGSFDFNTGTFSTPCCGINRLVSGTASPLDLTSGLYVQMLLYTGDPTANMTVSNLQVTLTLTGGATATSKFITVDYPGATLTAVRQINNHGVMVGRYILNGVIHAFILENGTFTTIDVPGALGTAAWGTNDNGDVVGRYFDPAVNRDHGFLYRNGTFTTIDPPGTVETFALGINNVGQIVGYYDDANGIEHGFLLSGGVYTTIDHPGSPITDIYKINNVGAMAGTFVETNLLTSHGFFYQNGVFSQLDFPGAADTDAFGINDGGQIVGDYTDGTTFANLGYVLSNGSYSSITVPGSIGTTVEDLNDVGQLVGQYSDSAGVVHGFVTARGPFLYVTNPAGSNVLVIDSSTNLQLTAIPVGPTGFLAASPDQTQLYMTGGNQVAVVDTASNTLLQNIPVGNNAVGVAFTPDGAFAYVANHADGTVSVIDTAKRTVATTVTGVPLPLDVAITPDGKSVYVTNQGVSGSVTVLSTATNTVTSVIGGISSPFTLAISPDGALVYIVSGTLSSGSVVVISTATNSIVGTIPVGNGPINIAFSPDGSTAYVDNQADSTISIINTATRTVVSTIPSGPTGTPGWVVVSPDGSSLYVLDLNAIDQISTTSHSVVGSIPATGIWLGAALFLSAPPTTQTITQPLSPTAPNPFNFGTHNLNVQFPPGTSFTGVTMTVAAAQTTQTSFQQSVAGSPFANASCIVYSGSGGNCVNYQISCTDTNGSPIPCPSQPTATIDVKTSYDTLQSIINPGFLHRPTGSTQWENIFTEFLAQKVDPTTKGKTKGFSDFVAVDLGAGNAQGAGTLQLSAPLRSTDPRVFRRGAEINIRFQLTSIASPGTYISDAQAGLAIVMIADGQGNAVSRQMLTLPPPSFRYSSSRQRYSRELEFEDYPPGTYALTIYGNAFPVQQVLFTVK
jgi:YVTN family beta-propeller protein/probable HAF family extracellular repeat protein